ncbi:uncharacterized protein LOC130813406 [Amaranthus tricolor]|uniref:uncharacterized protein LOC130813406 n=1 Tax=Amaranthus tricolor TaxID=29722 RepID=UPI00258FC484|nr:uncharacterized protein LOC130813406 [Amaranthus tricolor]
MALEVGDHVGCAKEKKNVNQSYSKEEEIVLMCLEGPTRAPLVSLDDNLVSYVGLTTLNIALLGGKSAFYSCNMDAQVKEEVIKISKYKEESLPFTYLGVKIDSKKLSKDDCSFLIDKIAARIKSWGVIEGVISACRNFLWGGKVASHKTPLVAWDLICRKKREGGLGLKESHAWNLALLGKYVWSIASKADNLWVKWINHIYLKDKDWKSYSPTSAASWYWKQLCQVKDRFRSGYNGNKWVFQHKGYTTSSGYKWLRGEGQEVDWAGWVWNNLNIPKHSFLCWLVMWRRVQTKDRLKKMQIQTDELCPLKMLEDQIGINVSIADLTQLSTWLQKPCNGRFRRRVIQCTYAALIYNIWKQRNAAVWRKCIASHQSTVERVTKEIYWRIVSVMPKKKVASGLENDAIKVTKTKGG